jgi:small subunit ribosomal protein S6
MVDSRPTDEEVAQLLARLQETLTELGASVKQVDNWGKRRLTYEIKKQREGTYVVFEIAAEPAAVKEFERQLRLNEAILRFFSTRVPDRKTAPPVQAPEALQEVG